MPIEQFSERDIPALPAHPKMITVNGLVMDAHQAPREVQEEALRLGLIPFISEATEAGPAGAA
jgi:hypothetical protein